LSEFKKEEEVAGLPEVAVDVVGMVHEDVLVDALRFVVQAERLIHPGQVIPVVNRTTTVIQVQKECIFSFQKVR
jgi:hypothetical protein